MEKIKQAILDLENRQVEAFNAGDVEKLLTFFDPGISGFSSTQHMRLASLHELKKTFEYYLSRGAGVEYAISDPCVHAYGDTAILTFYWAVRYRDDKKKKAITGRGTHVYHQTNGQWRIVHEHFSRAHHQYH